MNNQRTYLVFSKIIETTFGEEKVRWHRIGTAFKNEDQSFAVVLNSLPLAERDTGLTKLYFRPPERRRKNAIPANSYTLLDLPQEER